MRAPHCIVLVFSMIAAAAPATAQVISIETEWYDDSYDTGGIPIGIQLDSGCSGGMFLVGLDLAGEWTSYDVSVDPIGFYAPRIVCRGNVGVEYHFQLTFTPDSLGAPQTIDFFYTGIGYG